MTKTYFTIEVDLPEDFSPEDFRYIIEGDLRYPNEQAMAIGTGLEAIDLECITVTFAPDPAMQAAASGEVERLRAANYAAFTDGMEAAAQICGTLAEVEYDDADGFEAATSCEAAIMQVVKAQRREQAAIAKLTGETP